MKRRVIIGVMGGKDMLSAQALVDAERLGEMIAEKGWILLNGGRDLGIMQASAKGAKNKGGLTIGILPDKGEFATSQYIDIPIYTGMGDARNVINVLSSDVVVACPGATGTISEVALAIMSRKEVILMGLDDRGLFADISKNNYVHYVNTPEEVVEKIEELLASR